MPPEQWLLIIVACGIGGIIAAVVFHALQPKEVTDKANEEMKREYLEALKHWHEVLNHLEAVATRFDAVLTRQEKTDSPPQSTH